MKNFFLSVATIFILLIGNFFGAIVTQEIFANKVSAAYYYEYYSYEWEEYEDDPDEWKEYEEDFDEWNEGNLNSGNYQNFAVEVLNLVNAQRAAIGVAPLRLANDLQNATAIRAQEIVQVFSHTRPDGSDCFTVISNRGWTCGENIAAGHATAQETVEQWMNSEGHRENILNPAFRELGVGYAYKGYSTYQHYWVQLFRG